MEKFWFKYLAQTCRKDHHFVKLSHLLEEIVYTWSLKNVEVMPCILDLYWDDKVWGRHRLKGMSRVSDTQGN